MPLLRVACSLGLIYLGLIYLLELVDRVVGPRHANICMLELLPASARSIISLVRIALASMSRASSSGVCGGSAVVVVAAGVGYHVQVDHASGVGQLGSSCRVGLASHQKSKCQAVALPLDWVRIAARFYHYAHEIGLKAGIRM